MTWEWILIALPWLAVLACPLVMLWCMRGMSGKSCDKQKQAAGTEGSPGAVAAQGSRDGEISMLKARLARLEAQQNEQEPWK